VRSEVARPTARLAGQVAIVTGASSGIGRATSLSFAKEGATVVVVGKTPSRVASVVAEVEQVGVQGKSLGLALDVRREEDMTRMVCETLDRFEHIDILVASAGILRGKDRVPRLLAQLPIEEWSDILDTNLKGIFLSNRAVLRSMISHCKGQIVNISSTSGRRGRAYDSAYCASKFAMIGFSEALAEEVEQHNVRVQVLIAGAVETPILEQSGPLLGPRRKLPTERVADLVMYLVTQPYDSIFLGPVIDHSRVSPERPSWTIGAPTSSASRRKPRQVEKMQE